MLDFAADLRTEYSELRTDEELRAIAEQFERELAGLQHPHVEWLAEFAPSLWRVLVSGTVTVGTRTLKAGWDSPNGSAPPVQPRVVVDRSLTGPKLLERTRKRLTAAIDANRGPSGGGESPDLRHAVQTTVAHVIAARSAFSGQLSSLNEAVAKLFAGVNSILANRRGSEIELPIGVYNENAMVTYRLFEQTASEPYSVVPAQTATDFVVLSQGSGVSDHEAGASVTDAPDEGFRFVGDGSFEVHRTYQFAAFGAFAWSSFDSLDGTAQMEGHDIEREGGDEDYSTSTWEMSYVVGVKAYLPEVDLFPGSSARWWQIGVVFGLPVNRMPGAMFGFSWEPRIGMQVMFGKHWTKWRRNATTSDQESSWKPFIGVSFDSNLFASLFGQVAKIGGTF